MKHYTVCTPQYWTFVSMASLDPPEYGADCVDVEAENKRAAKVAAVKEMRKQGMEWVQDQESDKASPFTGLVVFDPLCPHGICQCSIDYGDCQICYDEITKEIENETLSNELFQSKK